MQRSILYILIGLYLGSVLRIAFPLVEYCLNQEYIAKVLCINKEDTTLNCNGKCYLMSRIAEEEKKESDPKVNTLKLELHFLTKTCFTFSGYFEKTEQKIIPFEESYYHLATQSIFRPPQNC